MNEMVFTISKKSDGTSKLLNFTSSLIFRAKFSHKKAAKEIGVSPEQIKYLMYRNKRTSVITVIRVINYFGGNVDFRFIPIEENK